MPETEDTIQQASLEQILEAVNQVNTRLDKFEKSADNQFEAIREGLVHNSAKFDRLEASEEVHRLRKERLVTLEK